MKAADMQPGVRYIVKRKSRNSEFLRGDVIELLADGAVLNRAAGGWIDAEDVPEATERMECEIDAQWSAKRRATLAAEMAALGAA